MSNCLVGYFDTTSKIDAYGGIPNYGCENDLTISAIWIPNTVKSIGTQAFYGCENLERIEFEDGGDAGLSIGLMAFENCSKLREVKFPSRLSSIGAACFRSCTALERIEFNGGDSVFREPGHVFDGCPHKDDLLSMLRIECARRSAALTHDEFNHGCMRRSAAIEARRALKDRAQGDSRVLQNQVKITYDDLKQNNPWVSMIKSVKRLLEERRSDYRFVLDCDEQMVCEMEKSLSGDLGLKLNLPPQPFIGDPRAPVWILQYNPGYSEFIDDYNYLGIDNFPLRFRHKIIAGRSFEKRIKLMCDQYGFMAESPFYALDAEFDTMTSGFKYNGHASWGMYLWYQRHLFAEQDSIFVELEDTAKKQFADNNLFILERFPYHSLSFQDGFGYAELQSFNFWKQLVSFAFQERKILLIYGNRRSIVAELKKLAGYFEASAEGRIVEVRSTGRGLARLNTNSVVIGREICEAHPMIFRKAD